MWIPGNDDLPMAAVASGAPTYLGSLLKRYVREKLTVDLAALDAVHGRISSRPIRYPPVKMLLISTLTQIHDFPRREIFGTRVDVDVREGSVQE